MRRGHPGIGGWRNETQRHFRPRGGGIPRYGHPQLYPRLNLRPEFGGQRLGPRPHRGGLHYNIHSGPPNDHLQHNRDRFVYRRGQPPRVLATNKDDRNRGERRSFPQPPPPHMRHNDNSDDVSPYKHMLNHCRINNMGDVDHRQNFNMIESPFKQHPVHQWPNTFQTGTSSFGDKSPHKRPNRYHDNAEENQFPTFTGHRPPSSDHYGGTVASAIDNSNSFSRSVDDTVDIVRKRLLNRNEPHNSVDIPPVEQNPEERADAPAISSSYQNEPQTPPAKKKTQRKQNVKSNCDKIKNKIVHQLFKMDKEKIHKLMDNPSSSTKFEYAISSLITESQNSLDRHLRSVAEKSLCSSSEEFIHNDNNTIYEDTFLKQMQCILEPQDTILLEDIKPLVMAELTKVLQLDEFEQRFDLGEEDPHFFQVEEYPPMNYPNEYEALSNEEFSNVINVPDYPVKEISYYEEQSYSKSQFAAQDTPKSPADQFNHNQPLYERRSTTKSCDVNESRRKSMEDHEQVRISADRERNKFSEERHRCEAPVPVFDREQARKSADRDRNKLSDERRRCETPVPVFNANPDPNQVSDEEDPFADLDKQYHVAVDHNFIEDELDKQFMAANETTQNEIENSGKDNAQIAKKEVLLSPEIIDPTTIKKEIDNQILSIAKSLKICSSLNRDKENHKNTSLSVPVNRDVHDISNVDINIDDPSENQNHDITNMDSINQDQSPEFNNAQKESERSQHSNAVKSTILPTARKRSIDQKPSHRKEKRKKSDTTAGEPNKQILNKNIIINVNDCSSKSTEKKCDAAKSIFNLFFSKDESGKELPRDNKNVELSDKTYSDKYVKRKETPKKKEHDSKRKRSSSTSHSIVSPKENNISCSETQSKVDAKIKLKPIDMFVDHPKKVLSTHLAHRNTAQATASKKVEDKKPLLGPKSKTPKRHVATQVIFKMHTKETQTSLLKSSVSKLCQTETKKLTVKSTQTNPVTFEKTGIKSTDTFERMKEIDLEIQVLLQEKFKLYNSLEAKESCSNAMHNLGMTVLNVTPIEEKDEAGIEDDLSADSIVDEFTNIPVEELEQIALESVQEITSESPKAQKRNQRQKVLNNNKAKSQSPVPVVNCKNIKKSNAPNISLIEQIITDDRPLEEIISLDDLERAEDKQLNPAAAAKKKRPQRPRRASKKRNAKKSKAVKPSNNLPQIIRECSVVLSREDVCTYFKINNALKNEQPPQKVSKATLVQEPIIEKTEVAEISIPSEPADIQFDMLDVSEDIVIGTVCEVKSSEEKDASGRDLSTNEDVILDNSQLSANNAVPADEGQSDECRMFDYSADERLRRDSVTVIGNADAVLAIECIDTNFIAACLDGNVYHFNSDGQLLATLRGSNLAVTCLTIVREKYGTTVYTGSLDSRIRYYDLDTGLEKGPECNVLSPIQTMDRAWDTVFVGTRTGFVLQFECKNNMLIPVSTVKFSEQSILALRALKEGPRKVLLVAARSENVTIKDAQTGLLLRTLEGPKMTVYTLLFEDGKVYCGTSSHQIHAFDYASGSHCGTHEGGKGCVCLRATGGLLFAGCYDGCVYVFREGEPRPFAQLRGPGLMLLSLAIVGTKVIAGYKDRSLYIWKIPLSILKEMIL